MRPRLGDAVPSPAAPESEALRRFRSFAASALLRGRAVEPSLDGLRVDPARVDALLRAWSEAAAESAGPRATPVRDALDPLLGRFRNALRASVPARQKSGAPRSSRRAVLAAIDRIADVYLAVDAISGRILDANPAAGAALGRSRDELLRLDLDLHVPEPERKRWREELDALTESAEPRRFRSALQDGAGGRIPVEARLTRYLSRERVLALILARMP